MKRVTATFVFEYDEDNHDGLTDEQAKDLAQDTLLAHPEIVWEELSVEDVDPEDVFFEEVMECPDCGAHLTLTDSIESIAEGSAFGHVRCTDDCGFSAREDWTHERTVRTD